jgi:hypothetical protein
MLISLGFIATFTCYFTLLQRIGMPMLRASVWYESAHWPMWSMFSISAVHLDRLL